MQNKYIDLTLTDGQQDFNLDQIFSENKNVVLLGVPGSGKSALLEHFREKHEEECELLSVKEFVKMNSSPKPTTKYYLLDGLDELRCASREKTSVIYDVVEKLRQIEGKCSTLISCREMDWYGDNDDPALVRYLTYPVKKVYIAPLSDEQKDSFVTSYLEDQEKIVDFRSKVIKNDGSKELLNVPQTLIMLLNLYKEHPEDIPARKIDLYERIVKLSLERKSAILLDKPFNLSEGEVFKYAGYIAYFYMMSDFDEISETNILKISNSSAFDVEKLKSVIELNLFEDKGSKRFYHRTIAEYLCAHFLFHQKIKIDHFSEDEILDWLLSSDKKRVPSDLRGVYAWFCSLTQSEKCFSIDPYGQYLYGDNSLFELDRKMKVVEAIGRYADQIKPYFLHFGDSYRKNDFYESGLDEFLINEYRKGLKNKNNYLFFLSILMTDAAKPTSDILDFAKEIVAIPDLEYHFKEMFVDYLKDDVAYLQDRLNDIIVGKVKDPDNLFLDRILSILYPEVIKPSEIVGYLKKYKKCECYRNQFSFLTKKQISDENLHLLVDEIYKNKELKLNDEFYLRKAIESVIGKHFLFLLKSQPPEIFLKRLALLAQKDFNFTYCVWSSESKDFQNVDERIKRNVYLNYLLNTTPNDENQKNVCQDRKYYLQMFMSHILPDNCEKIYSVLLESDKTDVFKLGILGEMYNHLRSNEKTTDKAEEIVSKHAENYGLREQFKSRITYTPSPEIVEMMQKNRDEADERNKKIKELVDKNREVLKAMPTEEKKGLWRLLINCAHFYMMSNENEVESGLGLCLENYQEMLAILKDKLFQDPQTRVYYKYTNMRSLVNDAPSGGRNVDVLYYAMLCLNGPEEYERIHDDEFLEYLYLIALHESCVINSKNAEFLKWFDSERFEDAVKIVQKFILMFFEKEKEISTKLALFFEKIYANCIDKAEKEKYLKKIQSIVYFTEKDLSKQEEIVDKLMRVFDFQLDADLLKAFTLNENLSAKRDGLVKFVNTDKPINKKDVENLIDILGFRWHSFFIKSIIVDYQQRFIESMMFYFDSYESMTFHSGIQSYRDEAAFYVNNVMLKQLDGEEGKTLLNQLLEKCKSSLWKPRIQTRIAEIDEVLTDNLKTKKSIDKAKEWVLKIKEESKVSITNNFNAPVNNSAIVGAAINSTIFQNIQNNIDFGKVENLVNQIEAGLGVPGSGFSDEQKIGIQSDIQNIRVAIENKDYSLIRSALNHIKNICDGVVGSVIASGICTWITQILG